MASLVAPNVPGVTSIGNILAQATQNAAVQSRTILAAASAIARDRQRAGELAADAIVRRRMENFQREQFEQKRRVEDRRLEFESERLEIAKTRAPLENKLIEAEIEQAPLRTALLGTQVTGAQIRNAGAAIELSALPQLTDDRAAVSGASRALFESKSAFEVEGYDNQLRDAQEAEAAQEQITGILSSYDGSAASLMASAHQLKAIKDDPSSQLSNPNVLESYNSAVRALELPTNVEQTLILPDPWKDPVPPGGSRTIQVPGRGQVTERGVPYSTSGTSGNGPGLTSAERLAMNEVVDRLQTRRDSKMAVVEERLKNLRSQRSHKDADDKRRAAIDSQIEEQVEELRSIQSKFVEELDQETERLRQAMGQEPVIENTLFGGSTNDFLRRNGFMADDPAQKKTSSAEPVRGAPSQPLPPAERTEGEFRIFSGPMVKSGANDADSFLVDGPNGEEHFRLYFADSPETSSSHPKKVRTSAEYFGISEDASIKAGKMAKESTAQWLQSEAFEVITRGERVMNSQRDHAMIYFPNAPLGERWLAERLVRNGMAMISSRGSKLPDGTSADEFRKRLREAEEVAKASRLGAWAFTNQ